MKIPTIPSRFLVLADQAVFSGGSFVLSLSLARLLDTHNFGVYSALVLTGYLFLSITNALVIQPFQVSVAGFDKDKSYPVFAFFLQLILVGLLCGICLLCTEAGWLAAFIPTQTGIGFVLWITGFLVQDFFRKTSLSQSKAGHTLVSDVLAIGSQFLVLGYLWFHPGFSFSTLMNLLALAYVPSVLMGLAGFQYSEMFSGNWKSFWHAHRSQGGWLLLTAVVQWWTNNLFTVASGVFIGVEALGAFRLVQSLFGILNMVFQTFENHLLPEASRLFKSSVEESKDFLKASFRQNGWPLVAVLVILFIFSKEVMILAGGSKFESYHMIIKGMTVLYGCILIGYPVRLAIRMMLLNQTFFIGYVLAFGFSLLSFRFLLEHFQLWGALAGLLINQLIMLTYWNNRLVSQKFILWK